MTLLAALSLVVWVVCCRPAAPAGDAPGSRPLPSSVAQAQELKKTGVVWDNADIRAYYLKIIATIAASDGRWRQEQRPAQERARRAFQVRHDARLLARAMMKDPAEVALLRARDREKYGDPDGPSFESLLAHEKGKGRQGDDAYEAIVQSAQRTSGAVNEIFGLKGP